MDLMLLNCILKNGYNGNFNVIPIYHKNPPNKHNQTTPNPELASGPSSRAPCVPRGRGSAASPRQPGWGKPATHSHHWRDRRAPEACPPPVTLLGPPSARVPTACLPCCLLAALPAARVHFLPSGEAANAGGLRSGMDVGCVTLKMPLDLPEPQFPFQRGVLSVK